MKKMKSEDAHDCIIGIYCDCEGYRLVTLHSLIKILVQEIEVLESFNERDRCIYGEIIHRRKYYLNDYLDRRKNTNLSRFNYCPVCGEKIDWKGMRKKVNG